MPPNDRDLRSTLRKLHKKATQYLFFLVMTAFFCIGLILVITTAAWHLGEVWRDIGISMLIAGTVGLGVELFSRKEMEGVLGELIEEKLAESTADRLASLETALLAVDRQTRLDIEDLRQLQQSVLPRLDGIRDLVGRESGLLEVGVQRLSRRRNDKLVYEMIKSAAAGSSIRVLGLCLNTLASNTGRDLLRRKVQEGCRIRLLLLDPSEDAVLEERARQENRTTDEDILEFKDRVRTWDTVHKSTIQRLASDKTLAGSIELGYYQSLPSCFLVDNGEVMAVGLYLHGCRGELCPHLEIENKANGLYQQFGRHFETLWARKVLPFDRRHKDEPVEKERRALRLA